MKKFLALLLAALMLFSLAACSTSGEDSGASGNPDTQTSGDTVEITLAVYPIGDWDDEATLNDLIADFNTEYPNVAVNIMYLDYTNGDDQLATAVEAGNAPDLIMEGPERLVSNWGAKGYLVDLSDLVTDDMYESTVATCTSADGSMYIFPIVQTAHCMAINYEAFEAADALQYLDLETHTWSTDDFINAVNALVADGWSDVAAVYCGGQGGDQGTRALVTNLYGGTYTNAEHTQYTFNCAENVKALEMLYDLDGINFDASIVGGDEITLFVNGTLAMAFCWNVAQYNTYSDQLNFTVVPMAFPTDSGDPVLQGGIYGFGVFDNNDDARIEASKNFIQFLISNDEVYEKAVEAAGYWPVRDVEGMYEGNELMTEYGLLAPYMGDYYQITLGWTEARTQWWTALQEIGAGADVQTTLDKYVAIANAAAEAEA